MSLIKIAASEASLNRLGKILANSSKKNQVLLKRIQRHTSNTVLTKDNAESLKRVAIGINKATNDPNVLNRAKSIAQHMGHPQTQKSIGVNGFFGHGPVSENEIQHHFIKNLK